MLLLSVIICYFCFCIKHSFIYVIDGSSMHSARLMIVCMPARLWSQECFAACCLCLCAFSIITEGARVMCITHCVIIYMWTLFLRWGRMSWNSKWTRNRPKRQKVMSSLCGGHSRTLLLFICALPAAFIRSPAVEVGHALSRGPAEFFPPSFQIFNSC